MQFLSTDKIKGKDFPKPLNIYRYITNKSTIQCDSERPCCGRCAQHNIDCIYTPRSLRDKRLGRHEERRARLALIAAMPDAGEKENEITARGNNPSTGTAARSILQPCLTRQDEHSSTTINRQLSAQELPAQEHSPVTTPEDSGVPTDTTEYIAAVEDTDTTDVDATSAIDMLATGAFDDNNDSRPASDIGYFGLSSNVALYRSLTQALGYLGSLGSTKYGENEPERMEGFSEPPPRTQRCRRSSTASGRRRKPEVFCQRDLQIIHPGPLVAIRWITRFFDSVGAVLPYVHESTLLREISVTRIRGSESTGKRQHGPATGRSVQALLSIVFAYALAVGGDDSHDTGVAAADEHAYYRQSLHLLLSDEQQSSSSGGGGTTVETVQALLLLGSYQQNSQRAMASLTSHALCVKASYQLGLHCRAPGFSTSDADKELRATLWSAVVNQDRVLSAALGRPCLIPTQNAQKMQHVQNVPHGVTCSYFQNLSSLHTIMGSAMDAVHAANLGLPPDLTPGELISKTVEILTNLARWQETSSVATFPETSFLTSIGASGLELNRHQLILSIHYHRTVMLTCGPVLMAVLLRNTEHRPVTTAQSTLTIIQEASASILKTDLVSLRAFQRIVSSILRDTSTSSFFQRNAVWWACNFSALTMCLHAFFFWLISLVSAPMAKVIAIVPADAERLLLDTLTTLRAFGSSSVMSFKAHRCLLRHVSRVRTLATGVHQANGTDGQTRGANENCLEPQLQQQSQSVDLGPLGGLHGNGFPLHGFPEFNVPTLDDLLCQLGDNDFMSPISSSIGMDIAVDMNLDLGVDMTMTMGTDTGSTGAAEPQLMGGEPFLFKSV